MSSTITIGETTFTDQLGTIAVYEDILSRKTDGCSTMERKKITAGIPRPQCRRCNDTTCYIVEPVRNVPPSPELVQHAKDRGQDLPAVKYKPARRGAAKTINDMGLSVWLNAEKTLVYIPVQACVRCSYKSQGWADGKAARRLEDESARIEESESTLEEKKLAWSVYKAAHKAGYEHRLEQIDLKPKSGRFKEKKGAK